MSTTPAFRLVARKNLNAGDVILASHDETIELGTVDTVYENNVGLGGHVCIRYRTGGSDTGRATGKVRVSTAPTRRY